MTALIKCLDCDNKISRNASSCPHCGCPKKFQLEQLITQAEDRKLVKRLYRGWVKSHYDSGHLRRIYYLENGRKSGRSIWFYDIEGAKKREDVNFVNGELEGKASEYWQSYDKPVATGYYHQGRKEGKWDTDYKDTRGHIIFKNGNIIEKREWFLDEQIACSLTIGSTSESIKWYENGQKRSEQHWMSSEFNEYLEGSVTKWYENGKLESKGEYSNGSRTGKWCYWYENGNMKSEGHFLPAPNDENSSSLPRDYKIGKWIDWWENGFKSEEGKYSKKCSKYGLEKKIGIWKGWAEDGRLEYKEKYVRGKCLELYP